MPVRVSANPSAVFKSIFDVSHLEDVAKESGFIKRLRVLCPQQLVLSLMVSLSNGTDCIAELHRTFQHQSGCSEVVPLSGTVIG